MTDICSQYVQNVKNSLSCPDLVKKYLAYMLLIPDDSKSGFSFIL